MTQRHENTLTSSVQNLIFDVLAVKKIAPAHVNGWIKPVIVTLWLPVVKAFLKKKKKKERKKGEIKNKLAQAVFLSVRTSLLDVDSAVWIVLLNTFFLLMYNFIHHNMFYKQLKGLVYKILFFQNTVWNSN